MNDISITFSMSGVPYLPIFSQVWFWCATQPGPRPASFSATSKHRRNSRVPKNQIYFPVVSLKFANSVAGLLPKRKDNLVLAPRMEPCEELSGKCPNLPRLLKMLASICRGEMKAWQGMMREDIWGVARCQVLVECMEEEEEKEDAPRMNWGFAQEGVLHTSICHPLFPCRGWIYDRFTVVRQRQISAGMVIWKDNIISWQDFCLECKPPPSEKTTEM